MDMTEFREVLDTCDYGEGEREAFLTIARDLMDTHYTDSKAALAIFSSVLEGNMMRRPHFEQLQNRAPQVIFDMLRLMGWNELRLKLAIDRGLITATILAMAIARTCWRAG